MTDDRFDTRLSFSAIDPIDGQGVELLGSASTIAETQHMPRKDVQATDTDHVAVNADDPVEAASGAHGGGVVPPSRIRRRGNKPRMEDCLHEAGHAVAHWYVGVPFEQVSVGVQTMPNGMLSLGSVAGFIYVPLREDWLALAEKGNITASDRGRKATEMEMFFAYAGPVAQARHVHSYSLGPQGEASVRQRERLDIDTILFVGGGECDWTLIEADMADWPEGMTMSARARHLACTFVRGRAAWGAITEVAQRLWRGKALTWDDVGVIASMHFGRPAPERDDWMPHWAPMAAVVRAGFLPPEPDMVRRPALLHLEP